MAALHADETRRRVLQTLLIDGEQPVRVVLDTARLHADHGFPEGVIAAFPEGLPIDLDPLWPMRPDFDSDPEALWVDLSFRGSVNRCRVAYRAVRTLLAGAGPMGFREVEGSPAPPSRPRLRLV